MLGISHFEISFCFLSYELVVVFEISLIMVWFGSGCWVRLGSLVGIAGYVVVVGLIGDRF